MHIFRAVVQRLARIRRFVHSPFIEKSVPLSFLNVSLSHPSKAHQCWCMLMPYITARLLSSSRSHGHQVDRGRLSQRPLGRECVQGRRNGPRHCQLQDQRPQVTEALLYVARAVGPVLFSEAVRPKCFPQMSPTAAILNELNIE